MMIWYAAWASQNAPHVLVCADDADVFILLLHHAHRLCDTVIELGVSGRNNRILINISELARRIGPQVSEISILALALFGIDQRLLITTTFPLFIPGMSSSCGLPCIHWLPLYISLQPERQEEAFPANDEWWRSCTDAFACLGETELLQDSLRCKLEHFTSMIYSRKEEKVNDARLHALLSKMPKKGPKMPKHMITFDPASLPPCQAVLNQKLNRVNLVTYIWKCAHLDTILPWEPVKHGWKFDHGMLVPLWFDCEQMPQEVFIVDFSPKPIFFIIFDGAIAFFRVVAL